MVAAMAAPLNPAAPDVGIRSILFAIVTGRFSVARNGMANAALIAALSIILSAAQWCCYKRTPSKDHKR